MAGGRVGKKMENGVDLNAVIKEKAWQGQAAHNLDHEPEIMYAQVIYENTNRSQWTCTYHRDKGLSASFKFFLFSLQHRSIQESPERLRNWLNEQKWQTL